MASAELIAIGTELLLGEIQDTNTRFLTRQLRQIGVDIFRTSIVGDNTLRIADVLSGSLSRADIVITTGGLGPTIDDPTRNAVALAFNVDIVFHPDLWKDINHRFVKRGITPTENNKKQAFLPQDAVAIPNPVGTAPAFYIKSGKKIVVSLPGVPSEMEYLYHTSVVPLLVNNFGLTEVIKTRVIHTSGMGESAIDTVIADLEMMQNPTVGLSAHPGSVDIRVTTKASSILEADRMIAEVEAKIYSRLSEVIYGEDDETLLQKILQLIENINLSVDLIIFGINASPIVQQIPACPGNFSLSSVSEPYKPTSPCELPSGVAYFYVNLFSQVEPFELELFYEHSTQSIFEKKGYSGPPAQLERWALNMCLDFIWKKLKLINPGE